MLGRITHRWVIGVFLVLSLMVVTGAAVASSSSTGSAWPAKCTTVKCVNRYLNAMHVGNVVRTHQIGKLQGQMVANGAAHAVNAKAHLEFQTQLAAYDKAIADMKATVATYDKAIAELKSDLKASQAEIAVLKTANAAQAAKIAALEAFRADLKGSITHLDISTFTDAAGHIYLVRTPSGETPLYNMLFEKAGSPPPPIFP